MGWLIAILVIGALVGLVWFFAGGDTDFSPRGTTEPKRGIPNDRRNISIGYIDRDGVVTERPIILTWIEDCGGGMYHLHAHCKMRKAERTFALDGIELILTPEGRSYRKARDFFKEEYGAPIRDFSCKWAGRAGRSA